MEIFLHEKVLTHLNSKNQFQRFHTSILKGPIPFMTHSSLLISNGNCWSGILSIQKPQGRDSSQKNAPKPTRQDAQNFNQLRSTLKNHRKNIWSAFHSASLFVCPQNWWIYQNFHGKLGRQRGFRTHRPPSVASQAQPGVSPDQPWQISTKPMPSGDMKYLCWL